MIDFKKVLALLELIADSKITFWIFIICMMAVIAYILFKVFEKTDKNTLFEEYLDENVESSIGGLIFKRIAVYCIFIIAAISILKILLYIGILS